MSHENDDTIPLDLFRKRKKYGLTDRDKIVFAYHFFEDKKYDEAKKLLGEISGGYFTTGFYKDIARALLCWATMKYNNDSKCQKESEFYVVVYRLTRKVIGEKLIFKNSGYFTDLKNELFKDFNI